jgi:hypothetical protein
MNAISLCYGCHRIVGSTPSVHNDLHAKIFGAFAAEIVIEKSRDIGLAKQYKRTCGVGEIAKHYKAEYNRMMEIRAGGFTVRLEFNSWL